MCRAYCRLQVLTAEPQGMLISPIVESQPKAAYVYTCRRCKHREERHTMADGLQPLQLNTYDRRPTLEGI